MSIVLVGPETRSQRWLGARAGPNGEDVPPIFIDRAGAKVGLIEQHSRNSKASLNLVLEQVQAPAVLWPVCLLWWRLRSSIFRLHC